ncbi:MAG: flagellar motor switch protein FliN [Tepidisphaeraceae bacterium]|jgi:flagellar motor switch protein FliN/FliY
MAKEPPASNPVPDKTSAPAAPAPAAVAPPAADPAPAAASDPDAPPADAADPAAEPQPDGMDEMLKAAVFEDPVVAGSDSASSPPAPDAEPFELPSFQQVMQDAQVSSIDLLRDVEMNVKIELGRNRMSVEEVLKLAEGSVVELDKLAGDPVDVFVNDRLVARGEVLVLNDNFCVRVNEIVAGAVEDGM